MTELVAVDPPINLGFHPGTNTRLVLPERKEPLVPSAPPPSPELVKYLRRAGKVAVVATFATFSFGTYKLVKGL